MVLATRTVVSELAARVALMVCIVGRDRYARHGLFDWFNRARVGGGGAVTDELDIDDAEDTETGVRIGFASAWGLSNRNWSLPFCRRM